MLELKPLQEADLEFVRQLRNACRENFFDNRYILGWQQKEWFKKYEKDDLFTIYLIWKDGFRVGTISEKFSRDDGDFSPIELGNLMLIERERGKGVMSWAIKQIVTPGLFYVAFVKQGNSPSLHVFEKAGFVKLRKGDFNEGKESKTNSKGTGQVARKAEHGSKQLRKPSRRV